MIRLIIASLLMLAAGGCSITAPEPMSAKEQPLAQSAVTAEEAVEAMPQAWATPNTSSAQPDAAYLEWEAQIKTIFDGLPYTLPAYDAEAGLLQLVYNISPNGYSLDLYRTHTGSYEIGTELTGLHTSYDLYYSYSRQKGETVLSNLERISLFGKQDQVQEGKLQIYGLADVRDAGGWKDSILDLLEQRKLSSAQVILLKLENQTNVNMYITAGDHRVTLFFAVQGPEELKEYLNNRLIW